MYIKKLISILFVAFSLTANAQFQPDTVPSYDFFIMNNDTNSFRVNERTIYNALVQYDNMGGTSWGYPMQDTVTNKIACEVPSAIRIQRIPQLAPALPYIAAIIVNPSTLEFNKAIILSLDIPDVWKDIIGKIYIVNRKQLKTI